MNHFIQILSLRPYVDKRTGLIKLSDKHDHGKQWTVTNLPNLFLNIEKIIEKIPEDSRYNLFYTVANCKNTPKPREMAYQQAIPFDIDGIDTARIDEYINPILDCIGVEYMKTAIVSSGNGLQFIVYTKAIIAESEEDYELLRIPYKAICEKIDALLKSLSLPGEADPSVWSPGRLMRLPLTENRKPMNTFDIKDQSVKKCKLIQRILEPVDFKFDLTLNLASSDYVSETELKRFPEPDTAYVLEQCEFLKHCKSHPESISEPQWYGMLSILAPLEDGEQLCHLYSKGHKDYNEMECDDKIRQAVEASGPRTCKNVSTLWDGCQKCPHFGSCTSPVTLQGPNYIKTKATKFHDVIFNKKSGEVKIGNPNFEDLKRYFESKYTFVTTVAKIVYIFDKTHWKEFHDAKLESFAQDHFQDLCMSFKAREFKEYIHRSNQVEDDFFAGSISHKMNFKNGVLCLKTDKFDHHSSDYGFRYVLPYDYDASAECPKFNQFMDDITIGRKDLQDVLMEFAGYAFSSMEYKHHKCLILSGEGSNGKSTFINVLKRLAGDHSYSCLRLDELNNPQNRYDLLGKLFNLAEETPKRGLQDSSLFKILTSGGAFTVKQLYKQPYTVNANQCKIIMNANDLPELNDFTSGLFRRLLIVPFDQKFIEGKNADPDIDKKLDLELPGIFNLVIEGYKRLVAQSGFSESSSIKEVIEEYKQEQDTVSTWFAEHCEVTPDAEDFIIGAVAYKRYVNYMIECSSKPCTSIEFGRSIARISNKKSATKRVDGKVKRGHPNVIFTVENF